MDPRERIVVALDVASGDDALGLLDKLSGLARGVKVGPVLFLREGPELIWNLRKRGHPVFLDLKLHDIPNTVALSVGAARDLGVWILSVHLSGGPELLRRAKIEAGE